MKIFLLTSFFFYYSLTIAQTVNDSNDIAIGLTSYSFSYNTKFKQGTSSIGPTFLINTNGKITVQMTALVDFKKYKYYEYNHFQTDSFVELNFLLPVFFQYNYCVKKNIRYFLTAGIVIGGNHYIDDNNETKKIDAFNIIAGTGISYNVFKGMYIRAYPTLRYSTRNIFPGFFLDLSFPFNL